jgi:hypothetical protein
VAAKSKRDEGDDARRLSWFGTPEVSAAIRFSPAKLPVAIWLLGAGFLASQLLSNASQGLSVDEAHYALYGYFPAWSYFDHPPLVGWLQMPAIWLGGSDFAMRCVPLLCWLLTLVLIWRLTRALFQGPDADRAAKASVLIALLVPMFQLLGMSLRPDTLLLPITCVVMLMVWRLRDPDRARRTGPWLELGATLGLAGLGKYTAVFLALSAAGVLLAHHGPRLLTRRQPWLAAGVALAVVSPVLLWNAHHRWISFRYQGLHAAGGNPWQLREVLRTLWSQLKIYGPLTFLALLMALRWFRRDPAARFCLAFALPPAAVIMVLSGRGGSLDYWTAFAWLAAIPLAGRGLARGWQSAGSKRWLAGAAAVQILFCGIVYLRIWDGGPAEGSAYRQNPFADLYGWDRAASRARKLALSHGFRSIAVMNWTLASRIAWYARPFFVYVLDRRFDQIDMWFGKLPQGRSTILVQWSRLPYELPVRPQAPLGFARCRLLEEMPVRHFNEIISHFDFYLCEDWGGETVPAPLPGNWTSAF